MSEHKHVSLKVALIGLMAVMIGLSELQRRANMSLVNEKLTITPGEVHKLIDEKLKVTPSEVREDIDDVREQTEETLLQTREIRVILEALTRKEIEDTDPLNN